MHTFTNGATKVVTSTDGSATSRTLPPFSLTTLVLRPSGTEPVIRVMVEGSDDKLVREIAKELAASVASAAQAA